MITILGVFPTKKKGNTLIVCLKTFFITFNTVKTTCNNSHDLKVGNENKQRYFSLRKKFTENKVTLKFGNDFNLFLFLFCRMFAVSRCGRCHAGISANELVMRARDLVYHLHCFSCTSCGIPLSKGDHFGMREGLIYCR